MTEPIEVDPLTAHGWLERGEADLIDVRESQELASFAIAGTTHNPMSRFDCDAIPKDSVRKLVFVCAHGVRSLQVARYLLAQNSIAQAYNMTGGVAAWTNAGLPKG